MFNSLVIGQFGASTYMRFIPYTTLDVPGSELWDWDHDFYYHFKNQQWGVDGDFHIEDNLILTGCIGIGTADPVGSLDISLLGSWKDKAKISFDRSGSNPVIKFYRPTGQDQYPDRVHSWWIENSGNGHLQFKSGLPSDIGMEEVNVKMHIGKNGEVGIGTTTPLGQFDIGFSESWNDKATISF